MQRTLDYLKNQREWIIVDRDRYKVDSLRWQQHDYTAQALQEAYKFVKKTYNL